jgi:hypothetical protein
MSIELIPLCTARITLNKPMEMPGTPLGLRAVIEMPEIVYEGERLSGRLVGPAAVDWLLISDGGAGAGAIDVRFVLRTDDDALIHVSYRGRSDHSQGHGVLPLYSAPVFETGDPRYAWLNTVQAIGKGVVRDNVIHYEIYEVR